MNPIELSELNNLVGIIKNQMPVHTENSVRMRGSYSNYLPKNIMDYSTKINNKFLNDNLAIIEEINHRDSKHWIIKWFKHYQNKIYGNREILNHDNFFKLHDIWKNCYESNKPFPQISGSGNNGNAFKSFAKVNGADLITNAGEGGTTPFGGAPYVVNVNKVKSTGVIGQYYNQIAMNVTVAAGNLRLCAYKDNAGSPDGRYVTDSGSFAAAADYAWHSLTEFALTGTANWLAFSQSADITVGYETQTSGNGRYLAGTFGELADPIAGGLSNTTTVTQMKLGHS